MPTKTDRRGHAREIGTKRCSMRTDRTDLATEATGRWSWSFKARHASGIQRNAVDLGYGAQWRELPKKYPPYQTCHRRFQQWVRRGKLEHICACWPWSCTPEGNWNTGTGRSFYRRLLHRGRKRGLAVEPPRRGKGTKIIAITDGHSLPLAVNDRAASRGAAPTDPRTASPWGDTANAGEWNDSWLHHFRRLVIRWEYHVENFLGMVRLGCMHILLRY
jgi:transposase